MSTLEKYPVFEFDTDTLNLVHTSRRQLGKSEDIANSTLVLAYLIKKANTRVKMVEQQMKFSKYLNNNATWRLVNTDNIAVYGFGDHSSVTHNLETGRVYRSPLD